jgi:hypothetical protein
LENNPREITSGSVLVLRQVSVFSPSSRSHYLNITPDNVIQVFPAEHEIDLVSGNSSGADTLTRETPTTQATSVKVSKTSPRISVAFLAELQAIQNETQGISESFLVSRSTVKRELVSPTPMETDGMEPLLRQAAITEKPKDARSGQRSTQRFLPSSDASPHSTVTPSLIPTANSSTSFPSSTTKASSSSSATHCQVSPQVPPSLSPFSFLSERKKTGKLTILETPVNTVRNTTNSVAAVNLSTTAPLSNTSIQQVQRDRLRKHFTPLNFDQVSENTTIIMKPVPDCMQNNVDDLFHGLNDADFDTFW